MVIDIQKATTSVELAGKEMHKETAEKECEMRNRERKQAVSTEIKFILCWMSWFPKYNYLSSQ